MGITCILSGCCSYSDSVPQTIHYQNSFSGININSFITITCKMPPNAGVFPNVFINLCVLTYCPQISKKDKTCTYSAFYVFYFALVFL